LHPSLPLIPSSSLLLLSPLLSLSTGLLHLLPPSSASTMPQIQIVVFILLLVQMAVYMLTIFSSVFIHPLVFIVGAYGFILPLMGLYAQGLRSPTGMCFFIVFSGISMGNALFSIIGVLLFNSVSKRENEWGELEMLPAVQNFLAFMDPTNAEYYLFKEGADRIRKGMTTAIAWIVLQAVYQVVVVIFYARARKEIIEEDRGVIIEPDFILKGDGEEVVAKFFADRPSIPNARTARLPSSHLGLSHTALRTARPMSRTDPRLMSSGRPLSGSGPRLPSSGPRGPGNYGGSRLSVKAYGAGPSSGGGGRVSAKSIGPGGGGGGPSRKFKFSLKSSKLGAGSSGKMSAPEHDAGANIADA
ncbi:hypothetical protein PRIPAC_73521, partial [Pristionchus pacificus]|uniref:Uncharacterized protein n=1 Tax=Pristionchus pacificus TaxID=54126 RepID=A0A2A6BZM9_PRIPA